MEPSGGTLVSGAGSGPVQGSSSRRVTLDPQKTRTFCQKRNFPLTKYTNVYIRATFRVQSQRSGLGLEVQS